jgi:Excalibur calcium-binding domain
MAPIARIATACVIAGGLAVGTADAAGAPSVTAPPYAGSYPAGTEKAGAPSSYKNCTNFNKKYPHGVGKLHAVDKTRSGAPRVTTFKRSTLLYRDAMYWNRGLDRDKDGIACEKN